MDQIERPDHINLPIAVLDGDNPATWAPFEENRPLNMLMTSVKTAAKPRLATALMMKTCEVEIAWVLTTPSELLTNQFLYRLAGMIIDACPENASEEFYDRKLDLLRTIFTKPKELAGNSSANDSAFVGSGWLQRIQKRLRGLA